MTVAEVAQSDLAPDKAELRKNRLALRDTLPVAARADRSRRAVAHLLSMELPKRAEVSAFLPIRSEIDIEGLLEPLHQRGHGLSLPAVIDRTTIVFRRYLPGVPLENAGFGTRAPGADAEIVDPSVMIIPLSVFDRRGGRIGYGAGHYDRALAKLAERGLRPLKVGCAFALQEADSVPTEDHDLPLDLVVTEDGVIDCRAVGEAAPQ